MSCRDITRLLTDKIVCICIGRCRSSILYNFNENVASERVEASELHINYVSVGGLLCDGVCGQLALMVMFVVGVSVVVCGCCKRRGRGRG